MPKLDIASVPARKGSLYPPMFSDKAKDRHKQALGDAGGLSDFGVNLVRLPPGAWSSQRHWHTHEDEFLWVLQGEVVLITDAGEETLRAGACAAFPKNTSDGHHLINNSASEAIYLEVGSRREEDVTEYPDIDMRATDEGYFRKTGERY